MFLWPYLFQLIPFLLLFYMAIEIYFRDPKNRLHRIAMIMFFLFSSLYFGQFLMNIVPLDYSALMSRYIVLSSSCMIMSVVIYFFGKLKGMSLVHRPIHVISLPPLFGLIVLFWNSPLTEVLVEQNGHWRIERYSVLVQATFAVIVLYTLICILTLLFLTIRAARKNSLSDQEKVRLKVIWRGTLFASLWVILINSLNVVTLQVFNMSMSPVAPYCIVVFALFIRYAMINYNFLSSAIRRYEILFKLSPNGIVLVDELGQMIEANDAYLQIIGVDAENTNWYRKRVTSFIQFEPSSHEATMTEAYVNRKSLLLELQIRNYRNELRSIQLNMDFIEIDGKIWTYMMVNDITQQQEHQEMLFRLAYHDALTGLLNRRRFYELLGETFQQTGAASSQVAVMLIDLDRFKWVNDTFGHSAGDELLITVAERLQAAAPVDAQIARLGGDEFVILLPRLDSEQDVRMLAKRLIEQLNQPVRLNGTSYEVTGSIGVSVARKGDTNPEAIMRCADTAMYEAKKNGRNRFNVHNGSK
ncbi:sensor domain-containing diguanylate cyclase [Paenibacillus hexagrammi]|uniref:Sensor domain-containing diguanylate cyclase n=1 Tax=Paenibacillus hexagrammi TaxID=2908839 RepID=A0ABY3SGM9_9BACL|nr:sensor domain-containing diguanylate cyclase [Paenibacillus sp. YPD9-1]UJF32361.1 sensor domain-containing diguanylate cyclase [Paenibacillus sp. YPD9-1]